MAFLLDTDTLVFFLRGRPEVQARILSTPVDDLATSSVCIGELHYGANKSRARTERLAEVLELQRSLPAGRKSRMIRTDAEYRRALERLDTDRAYLEQFRAALEAKALSGEEIARAMQPALAFHAQLHEEVDKYERMKRGDLGVLHSLTSIGRWLIGVRIARGVSQKELAERLDMSEAQVSRDETNDYHNVPVERAQRILEAMDLRFRMEVEDPIAGRGQNEDTVSA